MLLFDHMRLWGVESLCVIIQSFSFLFFYIYSKVEKEVVQSPRYIVDITKKRREFRRGGQRKKDGRK